MNRGQIEYQIRMITEAIGYGDDPVTAAGLLRQMRRICDEEMNLLREDICYRLRQEGWSYRNIGDTLGYERAKVRDLLVRHTYRTGTPMPRIRPKPIRARKVPGARSEGA